MSAQRPAAACAAARPRLGPGETAVVIVIIVMAVLLTLTNTALPQAVAVLSSAGVVGVLVVRLSQVQALRSTALRSAGRLLLVRGQE